MATIPEQAVTLHRLLGVVRTGTGYRHHRENPLPLDLLILDEASMVDVALMASLLDALPATARLILLGDRDQLASVEAGAVLGDICHGCEGPGPDFTRRLSALSGETLAEHPASRSALGDNLTLLRRSYRFGEESAIGRLAQAVNQGDEATAVRLLESAGEGHDLDWSTRDPALFAAERYTHLFDRLAQAAPVEELFSLLREFRLLCALRGGPQGVERMNRTILRHLVRLGRVSLDREWYPGRPVMVTRNDYALGLYNGDVGIVASHPDQPGQLAVAFPAADDQVRWVAPARLSAVETVFAMTVHKSQGSEFDQVLLLLPDQMSPVLCRELIYTAITRTRRRFTLIATPDLFRQTLSRSLMRHSGLIDLLRIEA
jgi:exodeoxyribonuclease V alpha subunit